MGTGGAREARWDAAWYAGFAIVALAVGLLDETPLARNWGLIASAAYSVGALAALIWRAGLVRRTVVAIAVFAGAALLPLGVELWWRAENGLGTHAKSETVVTEESARVALRGEDPYAADYSDGPLARFPPGVDTHVPYLPGNLVFGVVRPLLGCGVAGDARIGFAVVFLATVAAALSFSRAPSGEQLRAFMVVVVSPLGARYVVGGGNDLPVIAGMLLALVLVEQGRPGGAGLAAGLAAAVKLTAWPLLPFLVVAARDRADRSAAVRTAAIAAAVVSAAVVPFLLVNPAAMIEDVVLYPLDLTAGGTPASSPTLGGLLGRLVPDAKGAIAISAGVIVGVMTLWLLVRHPPRSARDAARATALVLVTATLLATAGRFGYLVYAVDLWLWSIWILRDDPPIPGPEGVASARR
jgi:hypothetical protein